MKMKRICSHLMKKYRQEKQEKILSNNEENDIVLDNFKQNTHLTYDNNFANEESQKI